MAPLDTAATQLNTTAMVAPSPGGDGLGELPPSRAGSGRGGGSGGGRLGKSNGTGNKFIDEYQNT